MPKPHQSDDILVVPKKLPNGDLLMPGGVVIDESHCMVYEPCVVFECSKCGLSVKRNAEELKEWCAEDLT